MRVILARALGWTAFAVVGILLALDLLYFARGSLELFPTAEDERKVRLVTGLLALVLGGIGVLLWKHLRRSARGASHLASPTGR